MVPPIATSASETWAVTAADKKKLLAFEPSQHFIPEITS